MNLQSKRILVFGGEASLSSVLISGLIQSGAEATWMTGLEKADANIAEELGYTHLTLSVESVEAYEKILGPQLAELGAFDGVLFALSEGTLRPITMTGTKVTQKMMEVNCLAYMELVRLLLKFRKLNKGSGIVALSSISSLKGLKTKMAYAASKAALNSAVLNMAAELAPKGIRVNAVLKGALTIDAEQKHVNDMFTIGSDSSVNPPLGMTTPEEVSDLCNFLLSDSTKTMTGGLIKLDAGYSL